MRPLILTGLATANPLGLGLEAMLDALRGGRTGLRANDFEDAGIRTWIGRVEHLETHPVIETLAKFDCRNHRLAQLGLQQDGFEQTIEMARRRYGPDRIGVLLGTTTSGILETELAYRRRNPLDGALPHTLRYRYTHNLFSVADFVRRYLQLEGPAVVVSTACSSSAKVFATAARFIQAGMCDAAVVGGVDSLCLTTLYGFASLGLLSDSPCRPCDAARNGLSIGEAAGFALLEPQGHGEGGIALLGYGESSDAYHMSAPHPEGEGAALAMQSALDRAGLKPTDIEYINLHGTGSPANDRAEDRAICRVFGETLPCSSTKGWTGHTLGAAGISEAIIATLCLRHDFLPGTLNSRTLDAQLRSRILRHTETRVLRRVVSNSFGFGGNNCSLIFGKVP
jgi:3-oxoacyl-[acyl-carrier-protein] synthase-1